MGHWHTCRHQSLDERFYPPHVFPSLARSFMTQDTEKAAAARKSIEYVKDGMVVGLGSGSTATFAIKFLGGQVRDGLKIRGTPTSRASEQPARSLNIPLTTFDQVGYTDVTIDGADEVAPGLALIK